MAYGFVNATLPRLIFPLEACLAYLFLEFLLPHRRRNSLGSYTRAAYFLSAAIVINMILLDGIRSPFDAGKISPFAMVNLAPLTESQYLPVRILGCVVAAFAVSFVSNFFYYWLHRAQHAVPFLWRFHRVHHSSTEMSAANSYHHFTKELFQFVAVTIPVALLFGVESGPVPWLLLTVVGTHGLFIHSSANINIGPLRYVIDDNRFHRLHHPVEERHFDRNFGAACFPKPGERPDVGLADVAEPKTLRDYLLLPLRR